MSEPATVSAATTTADPTTSASASAGAAPARRMSIRPVAEKQGALTAKAAAAKAAQEKALAVSSAKTTADQQTTTALENWANSDSPSPISFSFFSKETLAQVGQELSAVGYSVEYSLEQAAHQILGELHPLWTAIAKII